MERLFVKFAELAKIKQTKPIERPESIPFFGHKKSGHHWSERRRIPLPGAAVRHKATAQRLN